MALPTSAIQALLAAKANLSAAPQAGPVGAPVGPLPVDPTLMAPAPSPFPSTDPAAVGQTLSPLAQLQAADQQNLAAEQATVAQGAMQMLLASMAAGPNPMAAAAQGGPARPVRDPLVGHSGPATVTPSGH